MTGIAFVRCAAAPDRIRTGIHPSLFGPIFIALREEGIAALQFIDDNPDSVALGRRMWPAVQVSADPERTAAVAKGLFRPDPRGWSVAVEGTNFQAAVWRALLDIPRGTVRSYVEVARSMGRSDNCARAVGGAVAANPVAVLIPCHRVVRADGRMGGYRWGVDRKRLLLKQEGIESPDY